MRVGILDCLAQARADRGVTRLVITGGDHAFSAGADIKEMADGEAVRREPNLVTVVDAIEACELPVVAAIGGVALGGGCEVRPFCAESSAIMSAANTTILFHDSSLLNIEDSLCCTATAGTFMSKLVSKGLLP